MPHICLISPGHLSTNPRLVKEADCLARAGYWVSVITARYSSWGIEADASCCSAQWHWVASLPFGPLAPLRTRLRHAWVLQCARLLWRLGFRHHRVATAAWHPLTGDLIRAAQACKADLYIAHYPAALPAAALAAGVHQARYAFDAEDFHLGDPPEHPRFHTQRALTRAIESRWLPGACFTTAASPGIASAYASSYGIPLPTVVRNMFPLAQAPAGPTPCGSVQPGPTVYWFSQTVGPDRGLECAVQALALARCAPHLHLRGMVRSYYREQLLALAREHGVDDKVHFHPPGPPHLMEEMAAVYDVGLVSEKGHTPNRCIALTNKLFSFALAGLPMLLSDISAHCDVLAEAGNAAQLFLCEDPASLAAALDRWLASPPAVLAEARATAYQLGQEHWNWEREQTLLLGRVMQIVKLPNSRRVSAHGPTIVLPTEFAT